MMYHYEEIVDIVERKTVAWRELDDALDITEEKFAEFAAKFEEMKQENPNLRLVLTRIGEDGVEVALKEEGEK